jgi:hypothetical protein
VDTEVAGYLRQVDGVEAQIWVIVAAMLAALFRCGSAALPGPSLPIDASLPVAVGLAAWWAGSAVKERDVRLWTSWPAIPSGSRQPTNRCSDSRHAR